MIRGSDSGVAEDSRLKSSVINIPSRYDAIHNFSTNVLKIIHHFSLNGSYC